jgi:hypothetical protein
VACAASCTATGDDGTPFGQWHSAWYRELQVRWSACGGRGQREAGPCVCCLQSSVKG